MPFGRKKWEWEKGVFQKGGSTKFDPELWADLPLRWKTRAIQFQKGDLSLYINSELRMLYVCTMGFIDTAVRM